MYREIIGLSSRLEQNIAECIEGSLDGGIAVVDKREVRSLANGISSGHKS